MLKISNITKKYNDNLVLDNISLNLPRGCFITLLGKNGSGKSTLMKLITGEELTDSGLITFNKENIQKLNFTSTKTIGFVNESLEYLVPYNFRKFVDVLKAGYPKWDEDYFEYLVSARGIDLEQNFMSYSRGQKMQLALIINLAANFEYLLLDEITSVMDVYGRKFFLDELKKHTIKGGTVVMSSNIISELEYYTDQVIILKDRGIKLNSNSRDISIDFVKVRKLRGDTNPIFNDPKVVWAGLNSDFSVSYIIPKNLFDSSNLPATLLDKRKITLEDVFIYYFTDNMDEVI